MGLDTTAITVIGFRIPRNKWYLYKQKFIEKCDCGFKIVTGNKYCIKCGRKYGPLCIDIPLGPVERLYDEPEAKSMKNYGINMLDLKWNDDEHDSDDRELYLEHKYNHYFDKATIINNKIWLFIGDEDDIYIDYMDSNYVFVCIDIIRRGLHRCRSGLIKSELKLENIVILKKILERDLELYYKPGDYEFGIWTSGQISC